MSKSEQDKELDKLFKDIDKINEYATTLDDEKSLANISGYLSSRYYALNAIVAGDLFNGIPKGRVTTLFGPSSSGKSLISALLQRSAQEDNMRVIIFDTEFDKDGRMEAGFGVDLSKVKTIPIETIEELIIQSSQIIDTIVKNPNLHGKVFFVLDSLGFLGSDKEMKDATDKDKVAMDMGLKAKQLKTWARNIKGKISKSKCPFLIINHEIADPSQLKESVFKKQGGGNSAEYLSTVMIHISSKNEKNDATNEHDELTALTKANYSSKTIRIFTQKNRLIQPFKTVELFLNFETGPDVYSGLLDMIQSFNMTELYTKNVGGEVGKGRTFYLKVGDEEIKLGDRKEWQSNKECWDKILPILNKYVKKNLAYKAHSV